MYVLVYLIWLSFDDNILGATCFFFFLSFSLSAFLIYFKHGINDAFWPNRMWCVRYFPLCNSYAMLLRNMIHSRLFFLYISVMALWFEKDFDFRVNGTHTDIVYDLLGFYLNIYVFICIHSISIRLTAMRGLKQNSNPVDITKENHACLFVEHNALFWLLARSCVCVFELAPHHKNRTHFRSLLCIERENLNEPHKLRKTLESDRFFVMYDFDVFIFFSFC